MSYLYYADRIYQINLAIAGIAIGVGVLPQLSKHVFLKKKNKILMIKIKFSIIGAAAAAANLLLEFKIPEKKEDKLTNNKNGRVILVRLTVN